MKPKQERIDRFVRALEQIEHLGSVDMNSIEEPTCNTPGCHAGLAWRALRHMGEYDRNFYRFAYAADALTAFLFDDKEAYYSWLAYFAKENPGWWGSTGGQFMFVDGVAFSQERSIFPEQVIVDWWRGIATRKQELVEAHELWTENNGK